MSLSGLSLFLLYMSPILACMLAIPVLLVLHFLMPKAVLERYWKEPHFRPMELALFTNTIYAPMRTVMLMTTIAFPRLGRKRKVTEAYTLAPRWYRIAAKVHIVWVLASLAAIFAMMTGWTVYFWLAGESDPIRLKMTAVLLFSFACFGGVAINQWRLRRRESDPTTRTADENPQPSLTLAQLRPPAPLFRTSPSLYIVRSNPDPNAPSASTIFSRKRNGTQAPMVYLSPLDAVLDAVNFAPTFAVEPLENLSDSLDFAPVPGGRLSAHLAYGFAAVGERVILKGDAPAVLTQLVHFDIAPDASKPFHLQLDAATRAWLERLHEDTGMEDLSDVVQVLDERPYEELARCHKAWAHAQMKKAKKNAGLITHCALYDVLDQSWRFTPLPEERIRAMRFEFAEPEAAAAR